LKCANKDTPESKSFVAESPYVIVCEGYRDLGMICALLKHIGIDNCDVTYPKKVDGANGESGISAVVNLLAADFEDLRGIAIIRDADEDPVKAFKEASSAFKAPLKAPKKSFSIEGDKFRTGVFLIPGKDKLGALEHLLLEAISTERADILPCVETFRGCCGESLTWTSKKQAKAKMACIIATHCKDDPCCSLAYMWGKRDIPIDISHPAFNEPTEFLKEFSAESEEK
jgi:hypothetical protein